MELMIGKTEAVAECVGVGRRDSLENDPGDLFRDDDMMNDVSRSVDRTFLYSCTQHNLQVCAVHIACVIYVNILHRHPP